MAALARMSAPALATALATALSKALSTALGLLMVGSAAVGLHGPAVAAGVAALTAVAVGMVFRPAATVAVLLVVVVIAVSGPSPVAAGLCGLCAAAYLVSRHAGGASAGMVMGSGATVVAALGFTSAGLVSVSFPLQLPWLPLVAPLGALAIYVLAAWPFTRGFDKS